MFGTKAVVVKRVPCTIAKDVKYEDSNLVRVYTCCSDGLSECLGWVWYVNMQAAGTSIKKFNATGLEY